MAASDDVRAGAQHRPDYCYPDGRLDREHPSPRFYHHQRRQHAADDPGLAISAAVMPFLGIGLLPSVVALVVLAVPPILLNTCTSIQSAVNPDTLSAAHGMGLTPWQVTGKIVLPLAAPAFAIGRTAAVQVVGAALASFIGGGGLGDFVTTGIAIMDMSRLLVGAVPIILLAVAIEALFALLERLFSQPT